MRNPVEINTGKLIAFDDVTTSKTHGDKEEIAFDPSKAADAVIDVFYLKTTSDDKVIWSYEQGVYKPVGEDAIDHILDHLAGNLYTIHYSKEVIKKVKARTLTNPKIFDQRLNLFGVSNGVVDLESGAFMPYHPNYNITLRSPVKYDPVAKCPKIINFLWSIFRNLDDIITVLDMFVAMASIDTWEYFVAMIGSGSNGKTVLESFITMFFGQDQVTEVELSELNKSQFIRAAIKRKRALINSEVQGTKMESRWIKMISGGSTIDSDQKNKDRTHFKPYCLQIFDTNSPPRFFDNSFGFQRRLIKLDFKCTFVDNPDSSKSWEGQRNPVLLEDLTSDSEMSGWLNLIVLRAKDILKTKIIHRRLIGTRLTDEYDRQSHSLSAFFNDCYTIDLGNVMRILTPFSEIREHYIDYCHAINASPENDRQLSFYLKHPKKGLGLEAGSKHVGEERKRVKGYYGLTFEEENFNDIRDKSIVGTLGTFGTDKGTDKTVLGTVGTDKIGNYPVEILTKISQYIEEGKNSVPCVPSLPNIDSSVPHEYHIGTKLSGQSLEQIDQIKAYMCCNCGKRITRLELQDFEGMDYCSICVENESKKHRKTPPNSIDQAMMRAEQAEHEYEDHFKTPCLLTSEEQSALESTYKYMKDSNMSINGTSLAFEARNRGVNIPPKKCTAWIEQKQASK